MSDTTDARIAALEAENARLRAAASTGTWEHGEHLFLAMQAARLVFWNWDIASGQVMWVLGPGPATPTSIADAMRQVHPEDLPRVEACVAMVRAGTSHGYTVTHRVFLADGSMPWMETHTHAVRSGSGVLERIVGATMDVTIRRQAEESARASEERLAAIIENTPDVAVQGYDADGRVLFWNRASQRQFGYTADEAIGRTLDRLMLSAADAVAFNDLLAGIAADGQPRGPHEFPIRRKDGTKAVVLSTIFALPQSAGRTFVCMDVDITERKQVEEQVLRTARVESIGRLAGGVAHDFNNILTAILGWGDLAERAVPAGSPAARSLIQLRTAAERGAKLTGQLLAFARKQVVQPKVIDVDSAVAGVLDLLRRLIGEDVELVAHFAARPAAIRIDPGQFEQVLVNLAVNARDAMPDGGTLSVSTTVIGPEESTASGLAAGRSVRILVSDTGDGIPADIMPRIFEPFFTTKDLGSGTGLGLATCQTILHHAGGRIAAATEPGSGARFTILLPLVDAALTPDDPVRIAVDLRGSETVLVVEDEEPIRELTRRWLFDHGYRVLVAADGEAALSIAAAHVGPIDVLVSDVVMPRLGGIELVQLLSPERPAMRVLYTSGYADRGFDLAAMRGAGSDFLQKPYQLRELGERVRTLLDA